MNLMPIFEQQQMSFLENPYLPIKTRRENLLSLKRLLQEHAYELVKALDDDFSHRAHTETLFLEVAPSIKAIEYCVANLRKWTKPRKRRISWYLKSSSAALLAQPLGVIGIITPWNYPINLSLIPLAYALAAGNHVMIKFSELTPTVGHLLERLIGQHSVLHKVITIINGDVMVAKAFANLPFGHLLFTGSSTTGKQVMAAASTNLAPVTLELGGKSPVLISRTVNEHNLNRLFMGKLFNAGQTCVAPDYILLPNGMDARLEMLFAEFLEKHYPNLICNENYTGIISKQHKKRLEYLLDDAQALGARVVEYGQNQKNSRKMPCYLLFNVNFSMKIMNEEIFGPLLPVLSYDSFQTAVKMIHKNPNPLSLYYFGDEPDEIRFLKFNTLSGALVINDTLMHLAVDDLPFGGVGQSGMGHYHGEEGFDTFSKLKPVFIQGKISPTTWFYPPYGKLMHLFLRYLIGIKPEKK